MPDRPKAKRTVFQAANNSRAMLARHEAAHAVVNVRLGLPLLSVEIREWRRKTPTARGTKVETFAAGTIVDPATRVAWIAALPDPVALMGLTNYAVSTAVGPVADQLAGCSPNDVGASDDWDGLFRLAYFLGVGEEAWTRRWEGEGPSVQLNQANTALFRQSRQNPLVQQWVMQQTEVAKRWLHCDDGQAWDRVRVALHRKGFLSGDEVRAIVAESDAQRGSNA